LNFDSVFLNPQSPICNAALGLAPSAFRLGIMFIRIFSNNKRSKYFNLFQAELDGSLLSADQFSDRMRQERLRSERSGSPLSLVVIDSIKMLDFLMEKNSVSRRRFTRYIAGVLKNSIRQSDVKGWYDKGKIALLTLDTDETGARALAINLHNKILDYNGRKHAIHDNDLWQFVNISSLQVGVNYFANGAESKAQPSTSQQSYRMEFSLPQSDETATLLSTGAADLAVTEWPFAFEILNQSQMRDLQLKLKRLLDIVGSLIGIVLSAPLMLIISVLIELTSPGPILFRQERLGFLGKPFTFLKFRSMKVDCDESVHQEYVTCLIKGEKEAINKGTDDKPLFKITDDPRITLFGKFLRKSSLDELPQFFNVLKGDMSLVGPRPPIPYECDVYERWHCRRVLEVKPGITGLWQVSGRSSVTFEEMVRLDLSYVRNWSLWLDIKIILKTFWAVLSTKGGY
jgi:lipopolysaccharide/colanic/teichoic acid biosynthesis glycosyltransferase